MTQFVHLNYIMFIQLWRELRYIANVSRYPKNFTYIYIYIYIYTSIVPVWAVRLLLREHVWSLYQYCLDPDSASHRLLQSVKYILCLSVAAYSSQCATYTHLIYSTCLLWVLNQSDEKWFQNQQKIFGKNQTVISQKRESLIIVTKYKYYTYPNIRLCITYNWKVTIALTYRYQRVAICLTRHALYAHSSQILSPPIHPEI